MKILIRFKPSSADLLDAFDAASGRGMQPVVRFCLLVFAALYFFGPPAACFLGADMVFRWRDLAPFSAGALILWYFALAPYRAKRRLKKLPPPRGEVEMEAGENGLVIRAESGEVKIGWDEIAGVTARDAGILFDLRNGLTHWLPMRAFRSATERDSFMELLRKNGLAEKAERVRPR